MATFTAATFIPQVQPYQPDLNLYANLMQTKQSQYDTNWKSLNKMYGQYFHADLTRDDSVKKKDFLVDQINFNVGRLTGLDLSLEQNVSQATQIFKPFYEDKGLMKDMAWTKNYNQQVGRAEGLQGSANEKDRAQFWDTGLREMQYKRSEFKEATADKAMSFENAQYTPYINVQDKALELAKDFGNVESVNLSPDGRWVVKQTNGKILEEPLSKVFEANLGNDPQVQAIYKTQSYVNRKDYSYSNAAQFGGDKNKAEQKYLEDNFNILKEQSKKRYDAYQERSTVYDNKIKDLQKQVDNGTASPEAKQDLEAYLENKRINGAVLERAKKDYTTMNNGESNTATTSTGFKNPYGDLESLRYKVDNGVSSMLMQKDLGEAAHVYAYRNAKTSMDANPYAILSDKHKYEMSEIATRIQGQKDIAILKGEIQQKLNADKDKVAAGTHYRDEKGEVVEFDDQNNTYIMKNSKGATTDKNKAIDLSRKIVKNQTENHALPWINSTVGILEELANNKEIDNAQIKQILSTSRVPNMSLTEFKKRLKNNPVGFISTTIGADGLERIKENYNNFISNNAQLSTIKSRSSQIIKDNVKFQDYVNYLDEDQKWRSKSSGAVEQELSRKGLKYAEFLYDNRGNLRSEEQFYKKLAEQGKVASGTRSDTKTGRDLYKYAALTGLVPGVAGLVAGAIGINEIRLAATNNGINYQDLVNGASEVWKSEKVVKKPVVGLGRFYDSGTGVFTEGATGIMVNPKSSKGRYYYDSVMRDLNALDFSDSSKTRVSFKGYSLTNWDTVGGGKNDKGQALLTQIRNAMNSSKSSLGNFELGVAPVATGSANRGAVIIKPSAKFLTQFKSTDKEGTNNLLTNDEYNNILTNGINVMTNNSNFKNALYQDSFKDPLASYVDSKGSYSYVDPTNSKYKFTIKKDELGMGDYTLISEFPVWDNETGDYKTYYSTSNSLISGNNLSKQRDDQIYTGFDQMKQENQRLYNARD